MGGREINIHTLPLHPTPAFRYKQTVKDERQFVFAAFRLDQANECVWRGTESLALTPKAFAVLQHLVEHAGCLVTKHELLDAVWPGTHVGDAVLKVCVGEIRRALGDTVAAPRFIETAHRRGYRFIADTQVSRLASPFSGSRHTARIDDEQATTLLVGREAPLARLERGLEMALRGERQTIFITGEPGIGKTSLIAAFRERVAADARLWCAQGQCLEHYGRGEAYAPVLEAFGALCPSADRPLAAFLRRLAPTWYVQMPWLLTDADRAALSQEILGATRERMLREVGQAIEAITADTPVILVLEDLHWSDPATLDVVTLLAQRREPARLLLIGTYRPVDAILTGSPVRALKQTLLLHRQATELALDVLGEAHVATYLTARLTGAPPAGLAQVVHQRTEGNALFMATVVDDLLRSGKLVRSADGWVARDALALIAAGVPDGLRIMIEQQLERLPADDVALLEAAALARDEFPAAMVAAAIEADALRVELRCEDLARRTQWIAACGAVDLSAGGVSGRYRFTHELYRSVCAERVPTARRVRLHQRLGEWVEGVDGVGAAAELAVHFEAARDLARAIQYRRAMAHTATIRYANREAVAELSHALTLAERLPASDAGATRRGLLEQRGLAYRAMGEIKAAVADLSAWADATPTAGTAREEVRALLALSAAWALTDRARCIDVAAAAVERSRLAGDAALVARASAYHGYVRARVHGWRTEDAAASAAGLAAARTRGHPALLATHLGMHALFLNLQADYTAAQRAAQEAVLLAEQVGDSFTYALCQYQRSWALLHAGAWGELLTVLAGALTVAMRNEHRPWVTVYTLLLAWCAAEAGDGDTASALAADGLAAARAIEHEFGIGLGLLVSGLAQLSCGDPPGAARHLDALAERAAAHPALMEWALRLPLHLTRSECACADGDWQRAGAEADAAAALAAEPGERTYLALAHRARAAAALAARRIDAATVAITAAAGVLDGGETPLAAWRVWETAAEVAAATRGRRNQVATLRARSAAVREQLADSLALVDTTSAAALPVSVRALQEALRARRRE